MRCLTSREFLLGAGEERAALAAQLGVRAGSRRLERLVGRAKLLLERGLEGCADCH
jgi:hypothetical protein